MIAPSGGANTATLEVALANAEREYEEVRFWLDPQHSPFMEDARSVSQKFSDIRGNAEGKLRDMRFHLQQGDTAKAWTSYAHFRNLVMPTLANELLAVIGGMYLMSKGYDDIRAKIPDSPLDPEGAVSFSMVARRLVADLNDRSSRLRGSILIVGEERLGAAEAAIIRLRFPACDLWNLPFTAHEYGYLVGQIDPPDAFRALREKVVGEIDPSGHPGAQRPADEACFLPAIRQLWDRYYEPSGFAEPSGSDLDLLRDQQLSHLCRLFADAFATYFVGPAYIYALLHLRFIPDRTLYRPVESQPSFVQRLVFALETLRWMNEEATLYMPHGYTTDDPPFATEVDPTTGLLRDWRLALVTANQEDLYEETAGDLKPWLDAVTEALREPAWRADDSGPRTFGSWRHAQKTLQPLLINNRAEIDDPGDEWAILNAAWSARAAKGETVRDIIEQNALRLLDLSRPAASGAAGDPQKAGFDATQQKAQREADIRTVDAALRPHRAVYLEFLQMKESGGFEARSSIVNVLYTADDAAAYDAYLRLTPN